MPGELTDLFTALNMFQEGVTEFSASSSINAAANKIAQIKKGMDEQTGEALTGAQQFQQIQDVGTHLATNLFAAGKPATTVQTLLGQFGTGGDTPETLITQGAKIGGTLGDYMSKQGEKALKVTNTAKLDSIRERYALEADQRALDRAAKLEIATTKAGKLRELPSPALDKLEAVDGRLSSLDSIEKSLIGDRPGTGLLNKIKGVKTLRAIADPEQIASMTMIMQNLLAFQHEISGAAVNDKERDDIKSATVSLDDPPTVARKKVETLKAIAHSQYKRKLSFYKAGNFDVSGYEDRYKASYGSQPGQASAAGNVADSGVLPGYTIKEVTLKSGKRVRAQVSPDGSDVRLLRK